MATQRVTLIVRGMHCSSCVQRVERALSKVKGVAAVKVNLAAGQAIVDYVPGSTTEEALKQAVRDTGFRVAD